MMYKKKKSIRLAGFDYTTPGFYFVTISTAGYRNLFGRLGRNNCIVLSSVGWIAEQTWQRNDDIYDNFRNDVFCLMPNHLHALVQLGSQGRDLCPPPNLSTVIRSFKGCVTKETRRQMGSRDLAIWQNNFHEKIVNSEREIANVRNYILHNPMELECRFDEIRGWDRSIFSPR